MKRVVITRFRKIIVCTISVLIILISCSIIFLTPINNNYTNFNDKNILDSLKVANYPTDISPINIDDNWTETEAFYDWCSGSGTYGDPFMIKDIKLNCKETSSGLSINNSDQNYFIIQNCTFYNCSSFPAIILQNSNNGVINSCNLSSNNQIGIQLVKTENCTFTFNTISYNEIGISLEKTNECGFYNNYITHNTIVGVDISTPNSDLNLFYCNNFSNNGLNANDGADNEWDNGSIGNYWDDYSGKDANDDGIGDTSCVISGSSGSVDHYPVWWDAPVLALDLPLDYSLHGSIPPQFQVRLLEGVSDTWWYTIKGDPTIYKFLTNGSINHVAWGSLSNGSHQFTFLVNDSRGVEDQDQVIIYKDITTPTIDVLEPLNYTVYGSKTINYSIIILEKNINSSWYRVNGGAPVPFSGVLGQNEGIISQGEWDLQPNGTVVIEFYVNDTVGNLGNNNVTVYKDIIGPTITITSPTDHELFGSIAPDSVVSFYDINGVNETWYQLDDSTTTSVVRSYTGSIHPEDWALMGNGSVTITFFTNDSVGNIASEKVIVYKDIIVPTITITSPTNQEVFGQDSPECIISFYDVNGIDDSWYHLTNGSITTTNRLWIGSIHPDDWNAVGNGTITIKFFANDTLGNLASNQVTILKDIESPVITINQPVALGLFGSTPPYCDAKFTDGNGISHKWYQLSDGITTTSPRFWTGSIDASDWNVMTNGTVNIIFNANDTLGNTGSASVEVFKDIISPDVTINFPSDLEVFGSMAPECDVIIYDINGISHEWYQLSDGITTTAIRTWAGTIDASDWDVMGNGTITITFFANDTLGNIGSVSVKVYRDIISPDVSITQPLNLVVFGSTAPACNVVFYDINAIDQKWYQLSDGITTTAVRFWTGSIHSDDWTTMANGTVMITFYANDSLGNIGFSSVNVYKDIIAPVIIIHEPLPHDLFSVSTPYCDVAFSDINGVDTTWYEISNGTFTTQMRSWTGSIHLDDWNAVGNGTITIIFYANDTLGNQGSNQVSVYKDVIPPTIIINHPLESEEFGSNPPYADISISDVNGIDETWYQLTNGVITTDLRPYVIGYIHLDDWNAMGNGTVSIIFYANDTLGNIGTSSVEVYKDIIGPEITINVPLDLEVFGSTAPECDVIFYDINGLDQVWYQLSDDTTTTAIQVWTGSIDPSDWNAMGNGTVTITFYANDSLGNIGSSSVEVYKDIIAPMITINDPLPQEVFGVIAPACDVIFFDINAIDQIWYQLSDGITTTVTRTWTGTIDPSDWNAMANGTVTIAFYANDSLGNVNSEAVTIYKDVIPPTIIITSLSDYEVFGQQSPPIVITLYDIHAVDQSWYSISNGTVTTSNRLWTGTIHMDDWNAVGNGTVTITFYANDTLGNVGWSQVVIYKDIISPYIVIYEPLELDLLGSFPPYCSVSFDDVNGVDATWYQLTNGTITTILRSWMGSIHPDDWDVMGNGTVTITFYANDTLNNIESVNVTLRKDIIEPDITINAPHPFEVFGLIAPSCDVTFSDVNGVDEVWYQLSDGIIITSMRFWTGSIDPSDWNVMANGTVTITFYSNDTLGNIGSDSIGVRKDIIGPEITINDPLPYEVFGVIAPACDVIFYDINGVDQTWYQLSDGITITSPRFWTGSIVIGDWDAMANGTIDIIFFANDTMGNIGSSTVSVYRDIISPNIIINAPLDLEVFGSTAPACDVIFNDINAISQTWYQLSDAITTMSIRPWTGSIHPDDWNAMGNGTVTLKFFANDTLGNLASSQVIVYKDIIAPTITINEPLDHEVFGVNAPYCDMSFNDINGIDAIWYEISNGTVITQVRLWTGSVYADDWNVMGNGTITIIFHTNDTLGNIGSASVEVYKDIITAIITINDPLSHEVFGVIAPACDVIFYDISGVDQSWYQLSDDTITTAVRSWTGSIDPSDWNAMANGTVTITFYANDTLGNIGSASLDVYKDIIQPDITITSPTEFEVFGQQPPDCSVTFFDVNSVDATWYYLTDGTITTSNRTWTGTIHVDDWDAMANGTVTLVFFANDTLGNMGTNQVEFYRDIIAPTIIIQEPIPLDLFGASAPYCDVAFSDINGIDSTWYDVSNGTVTTSIRFWMGSVHPDDWNAMRNGTVTITFYANDTVNNIGFSSVTVYRDIIKPTIIIHDPSPNKVFGTIAPEVNVMFYDINGIDERWYYLTNGSFSTVPREWTGTIYVNDWNMMANGTVTLYLFANDTVNNLATNSIDVYRDIIAPTITLSEPINGEVFGYPVPSVTISFYDINGISQSWYQLSDGTTTTTTRSWTGSIHADDWNSMNNGTVVITFFCNDTVNNLHSESISIYKDIIAPDIYIYDPQEMELFGFTAPEANVSIYDPHLESVLYRLDNGSINTGLLQWLGYIDQSQWDLMGNGTVTIEFITYDEVNNPASSEVRVRKNIYDPIIKILNPVDATVVGLVPPIMNLYASSAEIDSIWYYLSNGTITTTNTTWTGSINENLWNLFDDGIINIYFYINDTLGNLGSDSKSIVKDLTTPTISVNYPYNFDIFGRTAPVILITFDDIHGIDKKWYQLTNGYITTSLRIWESIINTDDWSLMPNGTITIIFYANDTVGNLASQNIMIYKDSIDPSLTINFPIENTYWNSRPTIQAMASDQNFDTVWYEVSGTKIILENGVETLLDQAIWDALSGEQIFTITFFANDTVGNVNSLHSKTIYKDIYSPILSIDLPLNNTYWNSPPNVQVVALDPNFDSVWYAVDGIKITLNNGIAQLLNQGIWDDLELEGSFWIHFYANDSAGNINSSVSTILFKDVKAPDIFINSPSRNDIFGSNKPVCSVSFQDFNGIDQRWYQLTNGITTTNVRQWTGSINSADWDQMPNGTVTIIFYANDSLGNIGIVNVLVYKDIIGPNVHILNPDTRDLYGFQKPTLLFDIMESNGISQINYQFGNGTFFTSKLEWNGTIDQFAWDQFGNGSISIYLYAIDTMGNEGYDYVIVEKDILGPSIEIRLPENEQNVGRESPFFDVYVRDANLATCWYRIIGTTSNFNFTGNYGRIDEAMWEEVWDQTEENGTIVIRFAAIDNLGNLNQKDLKLIKPISQTEPGNDHPQIVPFKLIELIPLTLIVGLTITLSVIIKKSRFYNVTDKKHQKLINRIMVLVGILSTLIAISFLTH